MNSLKQLDDSDLVARAKEDRDAFGELYERYVHKIYNYIYYRTSNHQDAEDLTAKVFVRALKSIGRYDDRGAPFSAWLYRIAHNLVANWHRDRTRRVIIPLEDFFGKGEKTNMPESFAETQEEQERLLDSIQRLPEDRQTLLILKYVERLSNAEIGEVMDKTEGAIKSLYYRTLAFLRDDLSDDEAEPTRKDEGIT